MANNGHNITVIAADVDKNNKNEKIHYIHADAYKAFGSEPFNLIELTNGMNAFLTVLLTESYYQTSCKGFTSSEGFKTLLNYPENFKFDLIIYDFTSGPCLLGFAHKFKHPPIISVSPFGSPPYTFDIAGGHKKPSYVTHFALNYDSANMNFFERLMNTLVYIFDDL